MGDQRALMGHRVPKPVGVTRTIGLEMFYSTTIHRGALHHELNFQPTVRLCSREANIHPAQCLAQG